LQIAPKMWSDGACAHQHFPDGTLTECRVGWPSIVSMRVEPS
jgi:hypothetical protein